MAYTAALYYDCLPVFTARITSLLHGTATMVNRSEHTPDTTEQSGPLTSLVSTASSIIQNTLFRLLERPARHSFLSSAFLVSTISPLTALRFPPTVPTVPFF